MARARTWSLSLLIALTCLAAFLPYFMPYDWEYATGPTGQQFRNMAYDYIGPGVWLVLLLVTFAVGRWDRRLLWLLVLLPVAFGFWIFYGYLVFHSWLMGGFAP
jgi:hypothetical protein